MVFDPDRIGYETILRAFWEAHDPTQGMRQGNDVGTQYRSGIYTCSETQAGQALASRDAYQEALSAAGYGRITTEILDAGPFYYAEDYHQQYLARNPFGYCGHGEDGGRLSGRRRGLTRSGIGTGRPARGYPPPGGMPTEMPAGEIGEAPASTPWATARRHD